MGELASTWVGALRGLRDGKQNTSSAPSWFDSELAWFVNQREGEMGVRGMPVEPGIGGDPKQDDGIADHHIRAATRARHVEQALEVLVPEARLLLLAVHYTISPRAHKEKHTAQARCIEEHAKEIAVGVAMFRAAWAKRSRR